MAKAQQNAKLKKRERKNISEGIVHINASFNNTMITITDKQGNTISWATSGSEGFKGSRKSTPFAGQMAAEKAGKSAREHGLNQVEVRAKGPGSGRESAIRAIQSCGIVVTSIQEVTPLPHNGVRPSSARRV